MDSDLLERLQALLQAPRETTRNPRVPYEFIYNLRGENMLTRMLYLLRCGRLAWRPISLLPSLQRLGVCPHRKNFISVLIILSCQNL